LSHHLKNDPICYDASNESQSVPLNLSSPQTTPKNYRFVNPPFENNFSSNMSNLQPSRQFAPFSLNQAISNNTFSPNLYFSKEPIIYENQIPHTPQKEIATSIVEQQATLLPTPTHSPIHSPIHRTKKKKRVLAEGASASEKTLGEDITQLITLQTHWELSSSENKVKNGLTRLMEITENSINKIDDFLRNDWTKNLDHKIFPE
ncbi:28637_t:CDS:2, partial [Racocetra persica]